jgi:hypothetical protein
MNRLVTLILLIAFLYLLHCYQQKIKHTENMKKYINSKKYNKIKKNTNNKKLIKNNKNENYKNNTLNINYKNNKQSNIDNKYKKNYGINNKEEDVTNDETDDIETDDVDTDEVDTDEDDETNDDEDDDTEDATKSIKKNKYINNKTNKNTNIKKKPEIKSYNELDTETDISLNTLQYKPMSNNSDETGELDSLDDSLNETLNNPDKDLNSQITLDD